ncbi:MAG: glycosyltransferase [Porticoccaceae bacterium]
MSLYQELPQPLRVLHVYRTYFPDTQGGGEEVIHQACRNTRHLGVESRVFALSPNPSAEPLHREEADVFQAKRHVEIASCGMSLSALAPFRRQAAWADVLHYHFPWPFGDLLHLAGGEVTRKPTVVTYHSDIVRQKAIYPLYRPLMRRFLQRVDRIIATSPNYVANSSLLQEYRDRVQVIPIGLDDSNCPRPGDDSVAACRRRYGDDFLFFVGVLRYYKGLNFLLEAASATRANIVIAGAGPEEQSLKAYARDHGLHNVHFVGRISDTEKMALLAACRAMVFPSHLPSEAFGISLIEAAMMAKPMISCEIGTGTSYVNLDRHTGLVVAPADPAQLAQAMNLLVGDEALAREWGQNARWRYETLFTGEAMGRQYAALYQSLAAISSSHG